MKRLLFVILLAGLSACGPLGFYASSHNTDDGNYYEHQTLKLPGNTFELTVWAPFGIGENQLDRALTHYSQEVSSKQHCSSFNLINQTSGIYNSLVDARRYVRADMVCTTVELPLAEPRMYQAPMDTQTFPTTGKPALTP